VSTLGGREGEDGEVLPIVADLVATACLLTEGLDRAASACEFIRAPPWSGTAWQLFVSWEARMNSLRNCN